MTHRQPKLSPALRIIAAGCIVFWLLALSYCSIEHLFGGDHHHAEADATETVAQHDSDHSPEAEAAQHSDGEASGSHDSDQPSHDSHSHPHDGGDDTCCSSLIATAPIAAPLVIDKPLVRPLHFLSPVLPARISILTAPQDRWDRKANRRDWVFTPEVCLGPAHRSHAPPSRA